MSSFYQLMMRKKEEIMYATIKGTLTENDGVFSGFAYNNYLVTQEIFDYSKDFEIVLKMNTGNISVNSNLRVIARSNNGSDAGNSGLAFGLEGARKKIQTYIVDTSGSLFVNGVLGTTVFDNNADYFFKFSQKLNNGTYTIKIDSSTDGTNWTTENTWTHSLPIRSSGQGVAFGGGGFSNISQYWAGSIDLNNSYIKLGSTKYNLQAVVGYTIVGSPTIVDGVVSGFSSSDYLKLAQNLKITNDTKIIEVGTKITTTTSPSGQNVLGSSSANGTYGIGFYTSTLSAILSFYNGSSWTYKYLRSSSLSANTTYYLKAIYDFSDFSNIKIKIAYSLDNINWTEKTDVVTNATQLGNTNNQYNIGYGQLGVFTGSIDLNNTYIKINNKLWFNGQQA